MPGKGEFEEACDAKELRNLLSRMSIFVQTDRYHEASVQKHIIMLSSS